MAEHRIRRPTHRRKRTGKPRLNLYDWLDQKAREHLQVEKLGPDTINPLAIPVVHASALDLDYAQNNPPNLESPTMTKLYQEYLQRLQGVIDCAPTIRRAPRFERFLLLRSQATRLGQWIYPRRPQATSDQMLDFLLDRHIPAKLARRIVDATGKERKHRPPDPEVRREAIRAYDFHVSGKNPAQITKHLYGEQARADRKRIETIRQRVQSVKDLLNELGFSPTK